MLTKLARTTLISHPPIHPSNERTESSKSSVDEECKRLALIDHI